MAESVTKLLECPICLQLFNGCDRLPKLLPCQHTYCILCLKNIAKKMDDVVECPECRVWHQLTHSGVTAFPHNITIMRLLDAHKMDSAVDSKTSELRNSLAENMHLLRDKMSHVKDNTYYREQLRKKNSEIKKQIEKSFDAMINEVMQRKSLVFKELETVESRKFSEFEKERKRHQREITYISEQIAAMETALVSRNIGNEAMFRELLKKSDDFFKRLSELEPRSVSYLAYSDVNKEDVIECLYGFGCIQERPDGAITLARRDYCEIPDNLQHVYQHALSSNGNADVNNNSSEEEEDVDDDEEDNWSDDWDDQDSQIYQNVNVNSNSSKPKPTPVKMRGQGNFGLSNPKRGTLRRTSSVMRSGSVRKIKSLTNKFSVFSRTGGDAYLMDNENKSDKVSDAFSAVVVETSEGPQWKQTVRPYSCVVKCPRKDSKFRGIKTFMTYQITTLNPDGDVLGDVRRRYKQFWWLYERLAVKYKFLCVPPLPVRQIVGRYENAFIQQRMGQLQQWLDRICKHPIICVSDVLKHFLFCRDLNLWKSGKRRAEKDYFVGAAFFSMVKCPHDDLQTFAVEEFHDNINNFARNMEESIKMSEQTMQEMNKKYKTAFRRQFIHMGKSLDALAKTFAFYRGERSQELTAAMRHTSRMYTTVGHLFAAQPKLDIKPYAEFLKHYEGLLMSLPDMISFHKDTTSKDEDCRLEVKDGRITSQNADQVHRRAQVVTYALMGMYTVNGKHIPLMQLVISAKLCLDLTGYPIFLTEMNHFHKVKTEDFKRSLEIFLQNQIAFFKQIPPKLEEALTVYQSIGTYM
ncbi:uncharacterized protein [Antedon mediterranea]|uniref:uncharacterized protein n=1 Tax=Antedon mediterranea TaxID=105859 RepID=UPI003AF50EE3